MRKGVLFVLPALLSRAAGAQGLPQRIANIRDGTATFSYAARPDVCGNGHTVVLRQFDPSTDDVYFSDDGNVSGTWIARLAACLTGPVHVRLTIQDRHVAALWPSVGAATPQREPISTWGQ